MSCNAAFLTGMVHIWRLELPKRIPIGENRVAWDEAEVEGWIEARIRAGKDKKIASPRTARMGAR